MLPFSRDEFLEVFATYNETVWPAQLIAYALAIFALAALVGRNALHRRLALAAVSLMWIWTGIAYHWLFFSEINPAAIAFGLLFVGEGLLLAWLAFRQGPPLRLRWRAGAAGWVGAALIAYAAIIYPLIDLYLGHWPRMPSFGISPCPVTLFTLGLLMLASPRPPLWAWIAPLAWSLIGGTAAFLLGIPQDWALLASAPAAIFIIYGRGSAEAARRRIQY